MKRAVSFGSEGRGLKVAGGAALALGVVALIVTPDFIKHRREAVAMAKAWTIVGPPCPAINSEAFHLRSSKPHGFDYDGVVFVRGAGHVSCQDVGTAGGRGLGTYPVCQFTSPGVLHIKAKGREAYFAPGPGQPATISLADGAIRCAMGSNFTLG
jgi:hypothetical protein